MDHKDIRICERDPVCHAHKDWCDWCAMLRITTGLAGQLAEKNPETISVGMEALADIYNKHIDEEDHTAARRDLMHLARLVLETANLNLKMLVPCDCPDCRGNEQITVN